MISRVLDRLKDLVRRLAAGEDLRAVLDGARRTFMIQAAAAGLNYSSQIILAVVLGARGFGIYVFAWSLVSPLSVAATMGLGSAALRFVPQYSVSEDWSRIRGFIRRGTAITLAVGVGMAAIGWWALPAFSSLTGDYYIGPTRVALLCIPFLALCGLLSGVSRSFGWVGLAFAPRLIMVPGLLILSLLGLTLFVDQPTALQALVLAVATCGAAVLGQFVGFRRGISDDIRGAPPVFETRLWLRVAFPLFLSEGVFLVLWSSDAVMLGIMTEPDDVAVYHACVRTAGLTLVFFKALTALAAPRFAALWVAGDKADQDRFARAVARWAFLPTLALVLGLIVVGPYVLATFGESFVRGYPALVLLALGYLAKAATGPTTEYLAVSGNHNVIMLVTAGAAVTNIVGNLLLIPHFGVMGAASASVLSILLFQALQYWLVRRRLGVDSFFVALGSAR
jgi:O-antigen/teichoic acid export membrane protein